MKIRDRLTWTLSITALLSITILGLWVYISTARFHAREFFSRLEERVAITELIFLENDTEIESTIRDKFLQTLDEEEEYAISLTPRGIDSLKNMFPLTFAELIQEKKTVQFWQGGRQGVGTHYYLPKGEYAVIVTAVDTFGQRKLNFLRKILLSGGLLAILVLVIVDRVALSRALLPLETKIRKARNITADRLDLRLHVKKPHDEISEVSMAFNGMLDRLQGSFEAQRLFVRNASHEIQNPLTAIRGEAEVLLEKPRSEAEYKQALQTVLKESSRLQVLIKQLLDLEKTDAMTVVPDPEVLVIDECLLESLDLFPSGRFSLEFDTDEEDHLVLGNRHLIQTALQNILDNALKYSSADKPVKVKFFRQGQKQLISVTDYGIGIPTDDIEKIFQPFFRSYNALRKKGHGIGLALVKKIVDLHQGEIHYSSYPDRGTTVTLQFPVYTEHKH